MEKIIAEFGLGADGVLGQAQLLKRELDELIDTNKELKKSGDTSSQGYIENEARIKALRTEYNGYTRTLQRVEQATITNANATDLLDIAMNAERGTIEQLREQNAMLNRVRNRTNLDTEEGRAQLVLINKRLDDNNEKIKENVDQYTQQKIGIGDYASGVKEALLSNELFGGSIQDINSAFKSFKPLTDFALGFIKGWSSEVKTGTKATENMNKVNKMAFITTNTLSGAFKLLKIAIASTGIGLLVIALGSLIAYLTTTQSGMNALSRVTVPLQEVFSHLLSIFQGIGKIVFDKPLESLKNIYNVVKDQVMRQLESLWKMIKGISTFNWDLAKEGLQDMKDQADENKESIKGMWNEYKKGADEAWARGKRIQQLNEDIAEMEIAIIENNEIVKDQLIEQEKIMRDRTLSAEERAKAGDRILEITKEQINAEKELAQAEYDRIKMQNEATESSYEDRKVEAEALAKLKQIDRKLDEEEVKQLRIKSQIYNETNRLAKEAIQNQTKQIDAQIALLKAESSLVNKTNKERLEQIDLIYEKEVEAQKLKLKNQIISEEEYNLFVIEKANERAEILQDIAIQLAKEEARIAKRSIEESYTERKRITEEEFDNRIEQLRKQNEIEELLDKERLEQNDISNDEYLQLVKERQEAEYDLRKQLEEVQREQDKAEAEEISKLEEEERLEQLRESLWNEYEFKAEQLASIHELEMQDLKQRLKDGEISEELYQARLTASKLKYDRDRLNNSKLIAKQEVDLYTGMVDNIIGVLGEESKAGKAFAIAQALWNTYEGITAGLKLPFPANIPAVAFASKTGFDAVKNIKQTSVGGGGGSSSIATPQTPSMPFSDTGVGASQIGFDYDDFGDRVEDAVRRGSEKGTRRGSRLNVIDNRINQINTL